jgi:hypothetical protein
MFLRLLWVSGGLLMAGPALFSQTTTAEIVGKVADSSGALIPGASISIFNAETGTKRETATDTEGVYVAPSLQPGNYRVTVQKDGFRPVSREPVVLTVNQVARIDFQLEVGAVTENVQVAASSTLLDQDTSSLGQVVDGSKILNIPLNGRSSVRLVQLTPSVTSVPSANGQFGDIPVNTMDDSIISIGGGRAKANEVLIDGIPSTTGFVNQITTIPSVDATLEFKVQSNNLSAEFGRFSGGVINISTRYGTNDLHGSLYEFLRNTDLDANEYFNKLVGSPTPVFHMNQYGFAVGGPVYLPGIYRGRNRTFFFTDFQGTRWSQGQTYLASLPPLAERTGDFSQHLNAKGQLIVIYDPFSTVSDPSNPGHFLRTPFTGNIIPVSRIDPVAAKLLTYYPSPNLPGDRFTQTNNFTDNTPRIIDQANQSERIDHNITDNNRLFGRFSFNRSTIGQPDTFHSPATPGGGANGRLQLYNYSGGIDETRVLSPRTVLNIRYGFARFYWARLTRSFGFDETSLGFPTSFVSQTAAPLFPVLTIAGLTGLGGSSVLHTGQDTHSLLASLSRLVGRHSVKAGADIRLRRLNSFTLNNGGGAFSFQAGTTQGPDPIVASTTAGAGLASLLLGTPNSGSVNTGAGVSIEDFYIAGYVQDDIRLTSKLSINVGLRYETETPYTEKRDILNRWSFTGANPASNPTFPNLSGAIGFANSGDRTVYNWDTNNFAPRAGFAWTVLPHTVVRGGGGIFYAPYSITNSDTGFIPTAGYSATTAMLATLNGVTPNNVLSDPFPQGLVPLTRNSLGAQTSLGQPLTVWDPSGITPYGLQWNLDLQQSLPGNVVLDLAYLGNHGVKLNAPREYDSLNPAYLSLGTGLQTIVSNPFYGLISTGALAQPTIALRQLLLPYPQYTSVNVINASWGDSIYHAMTLKAEKRFWAGGSFLASYTFGKLITDVPSSLSTYDNGINSGLGTSVQNWYNLRGERSLSELSIAHSLVISYVAELPFGPGKPFLSHLHGLPARLAAGWQLSGIVSHRSGFPLILSAPITGGGNRPNSTGVNAALSSGRPRQQEIAQWFDTSQFTLPAPFTNGNVSRTLPNVPGPALTNFDMSLVKSATLYERLKLELRGEAFNLMNTPHLWMPNTALNNVQFGQISSTTGNPRVLQVAMKLRF